MGVAVSDSLSPYLVSAALVVARRAVHAVPVCKQRSSLKTVCQLTKPQMTVSDACLHNHASFFVGKSLFAPTFSHLPHVAERGSQGGFLQQLNPFATPARLPVSRRGDDDSADVSRGLRRGKGQRRGVFSDPRRLLLAIAIV